MDELRVLSPTAILGYGYPAESLARGMAREPHAIAVDGGSTDGGPYYLGIEASRLMSRLAGASPRLWKVATWKPLRSRVARRSGGQTRAFLEFLGRDVGPLLDAALGAGIPLLVGSAGFAGANLHLLGAVATVLAHAAERRHRFRLAVIRAEVDRGYVKEKIRAGKVQPLGPAPELAEAEVDRCVRIVGQMGVEPFVRALEGGAQVVVAGRANDPSMFSALPVLRGFDRGLAMHMAKILECGAIACSPGSGSDGMLGTLRRDHFLLEPLAAERRCTTMSVAAHSLYEKSDPFRLYGPGGHVDLHDVAFEQADDRTVKVSGSRYVPEDSFRIKLEGSKRVGYRTTAICGIRDPAVIEHLDELLEAARDGLRRQYPDLDPAAHRLFFHAYGKDAVLGEWEKHDGPLPHEVGLVIEVVAPDQGVATTLCGFVRSLVLHHGFAGRMSTAGNVASPYSPLDLPAGPVYEFNVYHLVEEDDPLRLFPVDFLDV